MSKTINDVIASLKLKKPLGDLNVWPPDVFALTSCILEDSGAYRMAISPPKNRSWPPKPDWVDEANQLGREWRDTVEGYLSGTPKTQLRFPAELTRLLNRLNRNGGKAISEVKESGSWSLACDLIKLHAIADSCCESLGVTPSSNHPWFWANTKQLLDSTGSLSRIDPDYLKVTPKTRTSQSGITIRSMSFHLATHRSEVVIGWHSVNELIDWPMDKRINILVVPIPRNIHPQDFKPVSGNLENLDDKRFGFFEFCPRELINWEDIEKIIEEANDRTGKVHAILIPEASVPNKDMAKLKQLQERAGVPIVLAGVRKSGLPFGQNYISTGLLSHLGVDQVEQYKHHRWCLERSQISQYHIASSLEPDKYWWEAIDVRDRELNFFVVGGWLTLCPLICEDLARPDPVAQTIRAVGPNLLIAFLQDGPQLTGRWPAKYASVLADDPGTSVLTITSLGMSMRSRPNWSEPPKRIIGLWKDRNAAHKEIFLEERSDAVVLTLCAKYNKEYAADGRINQASLPEIVLAGVEQIATSN